ncbi:hypothetical protein F5Y04DRAFT_285710 [Hypomontagnella monticulosa]|nr:hypothetical protein F5Y04DRAFT_285710 [Hypomontagnella monticulosa]
MAPSQSDIDALFERRSYCRRATFKIEVEVSDASEEQQKEIKEKLENIIKPASRTADNHFDTIMSSVFMTDGTAGKSNVIAWIEIKQDYEAFTKEVETMEAAVAFCVQLLNITVL